MTGTARAARARQLYHRMVSKFNRRKARADIDEQLEAEEEELEWHDSPSLEW